MEATRPIVLQFQQPGYQKGHSQEAPHGQRIPFHHAWLLMVVPYKRRNTNALHLCSILQSQVSSAMAQARVCLGAYMDQWKVTTSFMILMERRYMLLLAPPKNHSRQQKCSSSTSSMRLWCLRTCLSASTCCPSAWSPSKHRRFGHNVLTSQLQQQPLRHQPVVGRNVVLGARHAATLTPHQSNFAPAISTTNARSVEVVAVVNAQLLLPQ